MRVFNKDIRCLFVLSSPRSGSTLMRVNLAKIDGVLALPETHFFAFRDEHLKSKSINKHLNEIVEYWLGYHTVKKWPSNHEILRKRLLEEVVDWEDILKITIEEYCLSNAIDINKIDLIVEKSPPHIHFISEITNLFPNDYCLGLIRDPRDVCASLKTRHWSTSNCYTNAKSWRIGIDYLEHAECYTVRYEDFVSDTGDTLKRIFDFFNLTINPNLVADFDEKSSGLAGNFNALEAIDKKYISKWKTILSNVDNECAIIEKVCGNKMHQYGYEREIKKLSFTERKGYLIAKLSHNLSRLK